MSKKNGIPKELRDGIIAILQRGEMLPQEYMRDLFPSAKEECELTYGGKARAEDILAQTMAVPLQPARLFGNNGNGWHNMLVFGDNLQAMKSLLQMKKSGELCNTDGTPGVRSVYIDPPFGTGDQYKITDNAGAYSAKIRGAAFIEFIRKRLVFLRELLSDDGSIYIRIDYHFGHYIKAIADEVFGEQNFRNEIIVNRFKRRMANLKKFNVSTDSLFLYGKSEAAVFQEQKAPRICSFCGQKKEPGWHHMFSSGEVRNPARTIKGRRLLPPRGQHWKYKQEKIDEMEKAGRLQIVADQTYTNTEGEIVQGMPQFLQTEDITVDTNWTDLRGYVLSPRYPTENAEELLERVISASSNEGDLVMDAFVGSGTTCAVAEKLGRRWVGIDCGKLAVYTTQKRMLHLRKKIGNSGGILKTKPFALYNAGLYDLKLLSEEQWDEWRKFAMLLFECRDEPHTVGGVRMDGYRKGKSVQVFNHRKFGGVTITEETISEMHERIGRKVGDRVFIIAPAMSFGFFQDYIVCGKTRYYALRIPYSIINELHRRNFTALQQPVDESAVNESVEAVGFDFIRSPQLKYSVGAKKRNGGKEENAFIKITTFKSDGHVAERLAERGNLETLSMLMLDYDYDEAEQVFEFDKVFFADALRKDNWTASFPKSEIGGNVMAIFVDIYGNEARELIPAAEFGVHSNGAAKTAARKTKGKK